jgi:hypothetical protein
MPAIEGTADIDFKRPKLVRRAAFDPITDLGDATIAAQKCDAVSHETLVP